MYFIFFHRCIIYMDRRTELYILGIGVNPNQTMGGGGGGGVTLFFYVSVRRQRKFGELTWKKWSSFQWIIIQPPTWIVWGGGGGTFYIMSPPWKFVWGTCPPLLTAMIPGCMESVLFSLRSQEQKIISSIFISNYFVSKNCFHNLFPFLLSVMLFCSEREQHEYNIIQYSII